MGCTHEIINMHFQKRNVAKNMIEMFNDFFKSKLYYSSMKLNYEDIKYEEDVYKIVIDQEPLFTIYDCGMQVQELIIEFLKKYPNIIFYVDYTCTFSNCGDCLYIEYHCENNNIKIKEMYGNDMGLYFCPECEEEFDDALMYIEDYVPNKKYICPYCKKEISLEVNVNEYTLVIT